MRKKKLDKKRMGELIGRGVESKVYRYIDDDGTEVILKRFRDDLEDLDGYKARENKEEKLKILSEVDIDGITRVKDILYQNGKFVGYTMEEALGDDIYLYHSRRARIRYLRKIRTTMEKLNSLGIYVGDYHRGNFLYTLSGNVINIDVDNYRVRKKDKLLEFDVMTPSVFEYLDSGCPEELIDRYCYNIFFLRLMSYSSQGKFKLDKVKRPPVGMDTEHNRKVLEEIQNINTLGPNYKGLVFQYTPKKEDE
jgi:hypothetical protein